MYILFFNITCHFWRNKSDHTPPSLEINEAAFRRWNSLRGHPGGGGGVLRKISDGDERSPFLGLKFAIWGLFLGLKFCSDFFWVRDFGKDFFGVWQQAKPRVLVSYVKQLYQFHLLKKGGCKNCLKFSWIIIIIFLIGLFCVTFWAIGLFLGQGLPWWTFFGSNNFASFAHPRH